MQRSKKDAFSLVELLVTLIVVSCIIAAFAPVMTKRLKREIGILKNKINNHKLYLVTTNGGVFSASDNSYTFTFKVPQGVTKLNAIVVGAGSGGAGGTLGINEKIIVEAPCGGTKTLEITPDMKNLKIEELVGGGGGGGAGATGPAAPASQADCTPYDAYYYNGLCITKKDLTYGALRDAQTHCSAYPCCWNYQAVTSSGSQNLTTSYPVCNYAAAEYICSNYKSSQDSAIGNWRLATVNELQGVNLSAFGICTTCPASPAQNVSVGQGSTSGAYCYDGHDSMDYWRAISQCVPSSIWLNNWATTQTNDGASFSIGATVRCVRDQMPSSGLIGAGGSSGGRVTNYRGTSLEQHFNEHLNQDKPTKIILKSGSGGKGATYAAEAAKGGVSAVEFSGGILNYAWYASGGIPGASASITNSIPAGGTSNSWGYIGTLSWVSGRNSVDLDGEFYSGKDGGACKDQAGNGGFKTSYANSGTCSDDSAVVRYGGNNGRVGANYGGGGGGGFSYDSNNKPAPGGDGACGRAAISYEVEYRGAAGGGGASGGLLHVKDFPVTPGQTCTIMVGKGGKGGNIGNNGTRGGISKITCSGNIINSGKAAYGTAGTAETSSTLDSVAVDYRNEYDKAWGRQGRTEVVYDSAYNTSITVQGVQKTLSNITNSNYNTTLKDFMNFDKVQVIKAVGAIYSVSYATNLTKYTKYYNQTIGSYSPLNATVENNTWIGIGGYGWSSPVEPGYYICGGLNQDADAAMPCSNSSVDAEETSRFKGPDPLDSDSYGLAGAGGAGGGWLKDGNVAGKGSDGQNGYVYIYWDEP